MNSAERWKEKYENSRDEVVRLLVERDNVGLTDEEAIKKLRDRIDSWSPVDDIATEHIERDK